MRTKSVDHLRYLRGVPYYRAVLTTGTRPAIELNVAPGDETAAVARANIIDRMLNQLREAGRPQFEEHWLKKMANASAPEEVEGYELAVKAICAGIVKEKPI